ncbi:MAG: hypothetical protein J2P17_30435, partial [Mycobacterium sp.]|nr:hypothetical protein [Mycobacterium sp.]
MSHQRVLTASNLERRVLEPWLKSKRELQSCGLEPRHRSRVLGGGGNVRRDCQCAEWYCGRQRRER